MQLTYNGSGYGTVYFPSSVTLGTGGTMTFSWQRGIAARRPDVRCFYPTIPGLAVITSPAATTDGGAAIIDTSADLSVTWLPISIGQIHFHLDGGDLRTRRHRGRSHCGTSSKDPLALEWFLTCCSRR